MSDRIPTPPSTPAAPRARDRSHTRICLTDAAHTGPMVSLFLVPEPRVRGASMLHLLEQVPVRDVPAPDPELTAALEAPSLPGAAIRLLPCASRRSDTSAMRHIFHDHYIADGPMGLDVCDSEEMARLAALPEHAIGPRRIDDFADYSVRQAMLAVFRYFGVDQRIPLMYHGYADPGGRWLAVRTALA
ncbi:MULTISPECIES: hypothetical protein [Nocardia]|uniref:Uncharacterized protein n=2 Tax=Nocardia TaxID=1817 RepID=A0A2T2Z3W6_9NOCA|nr:MULTISPECIES: hypothetical protein [Nocardia]MBF6448747.1 hypothetical protein [Nocardia elegans]PSR62466.1 hypothetical protein C8259_16215 [Nocardia nova]